jgi:hypothetical protein
LKIEYKKLKKTLKTSKIIKISKKYQVHFNEGSPVENSAGGVGGARHHLPLSLPMAVVGRGRPHDDGDGEEDEEDQVAAEVDEGPSTTSTTSSSTTWWCPTSTPSTFPSSSASPSPTGSSARAQNPAGVLVVTFPAPKLVERIRLFYGNGSTNMSSSTTVTPLPSLAYAPEAGSRFIAYTGVISPIPLTGMTNPNVTITVMIGNFVLNPPVEAQRLRIAFTAPACNKKKFKIKYSCY